MKTISKHVQEPWFSHIKTGKKQVEGRLNKSSFSTLQVGDKIIWNNGKQKITTVVVSIHHHKDFKKMLKQHRLKNTLPGIKTIEDGVKIYSKFYSKKDIIKYGVLAIKLTML